MDNHSCIDDWHFPEASINPRRWAVAEKIPWKDGNNWAERNTMACSSCPRDLHRPSSRIGVKSVMMLYLCCCNFDLFMGVETYSLKPSVEEAVDQFTSRSLFVVTRYEIQVGYQCHLQIALQIDLRWLVSKKILKGNWKWMHSIMNTFVVTPRCLPWGNEDQP